MEYAVLAVAGILVGFIAARLFASSKAKKIQDTIDDALHKAKQVIADAEKKEQDVLLRAKDKAIKILEEARIEEKRALEELKHEQHELAARENEFGKKLLDIDEQRKRIETKTKEIDEEKKRVVDIKEEEATKLQEVAGLTRDKALEQLMKIVEEQHQDTILSRM
ncbi:MAG: Rnase Y domain-containing protein, partial [Patescibacteria group bacterium]